MKNHNIALRYAKALLDLGQTQERCQLYLSQLRQVEGFLTQEPEAAYLLNSGRIHTQKKKDLIISLFQNRLEKNLLSLLLLLQDKERMEYFSPIIDAFEEEIHEKFGYIKAKVRSAMEISTEEEEEIRIGLESFTGKKAIIEKELNPAQIGGLIIQIGDTVYDGSIKCQLKQLAQRMTKQR